MPSGVYVRTEEGKKHMSEALKGNHYPKMSEAKKGKPSPTKGKHYGKHLFPMSEKGKLNIAEAHKGNLLSEKHRKHISEAHKGKHLSEETKKQISEALKGLKSSNWKGGISLKKGYRNFIERKRQIKKLGNGGSHTFGEWENLKAQYNRTCPVCGRSESEIVLTEDHIVPISKGGSNNIENIQPLCQSCNSKKYTKIFRVNPDGSLKLF